MPFGRWFFVVSVASTTLLWTVGSGVGGADARSKASAAREDFRSEPVGEVVHEA